LISRGVNRVARTKLCVSIFRMLRDAPPPIVQAFAEGCGRPAASGHPSGNSLARRTK
jgi:hypothetical protein